MMGAARRSCACDERARVQLSVRSCAGGCVCVCGVPAKKSEERARARTNKQQLL
jgi:hypothetical protein